ncbi:MAG: hypothetical protein A2186_03730 [Candidatus Levybacteria bacterium RIFOXYA1_FULL_41_10]|nr:MAG: hypothetical protein UT46_C0006G0009 [Candidatus Levybacteria bacterium GW2011_GWA1_39_34]KKR50834.1 MAG: hypothetical protein UT87_C0011G0012 [Candidatus Levybacteria bacterium GW2011_GWC1_40_19]KKS01781.1 MAG: hypothetical protein UU52_C0007G0011 [Candidatus Levybacteria bacterium GW2011_GWB1_41_21]OGH20364.1 MAG: hypothetical protein A2695_02250 [Candidatus Levybacteria bacterium RIFCSPHIGHO2_01_FULL_40_83]OGH25154.1 MAG: hypothetical protein A3D82_00755 [Candidatus Levybacteria bact
MITLYHGSDIVSSRIAFVDQKDETSLSFDAENTSVQDLLQALEESSMFTTSQKIFIENLFTKKSSTFLKSTAEILQKKSKDVEIHLWEGSEVSSKAASIFKGINVKSFKLPQNLFAFLDSIRPGNTQALDLFHKTLREVDENVILFMLIRQFRLLIATFYRAYGIEEAKRMAPWQKSKFKHQADYFNEGRLKSAYKKLYDLDRGHKTGSLNMSLSQSIDFFLLGL